MDSLPAELLAHVFSFLPPEEAARGRLLNKHIRNSLTLYRRRLQRPIAKKLCVTLFRTTNGVAASVYVECRLHKNEGTVDYFYCTENRLLATNKCPALYSHFKELKECRDDVRQKIGSLAESLDIALQWVTNEMFLEELKIDCCRGSLTPELMDALVKAGRKVSEEEPYAKLSLVLSEDLLPTHVDFLNHFRDWKVRLHAEGYSTDALSQITVSYFYIEEFEPHLKNLNLTAFLEMLVNRLKGGDGLLEYSFARGIMDTVVEVLQRFKLPLINHRIFPYYQLNCAGGAYKIYVASGRFTVTNSNRPRSLIDWKFCRSKLYLSHSQ